MVRERESFPLTAAAARDIYNLPTPHHQNSQLSDCHSVSLAAKSIQIFSTLNITSADLPLSAISDFPAGKKLS